MRRFRRVQAEEPAEYIIERTPTTRYRPNYEEGLTRKQVAEHMEDGWANVPVDPPAQTTQEIIKENVFTYFNLVFLVLAILLAIASAWRDMLFLPIIIANTLIGIVQEVHSKKVLDNLSYIISFRH